MVEVDKLFVILVADDDVEDYLLVKDALAETGIPHDLRFVRDGEELCEYLHHKGVYAQGQDAPRPHLILLDLKMPRKNGLEALEQIKADPQTRRIPVVALTTSMAAEDVRCCYDAGVNAYVTKPVSYQTLIDIMKSMAGYWFEVVKLPPRD